MKALKIVLVICFFFVIFIQNLQAVTLVKGGSFDENASELQMYLSEESGVWTYVFWVPVIVGRESGITRSSNGFDLNFWCPKMKRHFKWELVFEAKEYECEIWPKNKKGIGWEEYVFILKPI